MIYAILYCVGIVSSMSVAAVRCGYANSDIDWEDLVVRGFFWPVGIVALGFEAGPYKWGKTLRQRAAERQRLLDEANRHMAELDRYIDGGGAHKPAGHSEVCPCAGCSVIKRKAGCV